MSVPILTLPSSSFEIPVEGVVPAAVDMKRRASGRRSKASESHSAASDRAEVIVVGASPTLVSTYLPALQRLEREQRIRVRALVAADSSRTLLQTSFPEVEVVESLDRVIAAPGALVLLCSASRMRVAHATAAFRHGWHVFAEAPLAETAKDASQILAAAVRQERHVFVDTHRRRFPAADFLGRLCRDHLLGPLVRFTAHHSEPALGPYHDGVLTTAGAPLIDLLCHWLGNLSVVRYADDAMGGSEATALVEFATAEGASGSLHLTREPALLPQSEFVFERGTAWWSWEEPHRIRLKLASMPMDLDAQLQPQAPPDPSREAPLRPQDFFSDVISEAVASTTKAPIRTTSDAMPALQLIDQCYLRRNLLELPWLNRNETARARGLSAPSAIRRL